MPMFWGIGNYTSFAKVWQKRIDSSENRTLSWRKRFKAQEESSLWWITVTARMKITEWQIMKATKRK